MLTEWTPTVWERYDAERQVLLRVEEVFPAAAAQHARYRFRLLRGTQALAWSKPSAYATPEAAMEAADEALCGIKVPATPADQKG